MRRALYVLIVVAMLVIPASVAYAAPPDVPRQFEGQWYLGEVVDVTVAGLFAPGERADAWLTRPSTEAGWPLSAAPIGGPGGAGWLVVGDSQTRRMSYAEDPNLVANQFGVWNAVFMLPRDEVWYPCSFPLKWKCNFEVAPGVWELHSPVFVDYDPSIPAYLQYWPWIDVFGPAADPQDTIAPMYLDVVNYLPAPFTTGWGFEMEIVGYTWKWSDIP